MNETNAAANAMPDAAYRWMKECPPNRSPLARERAARAWADYKSRGFVFNPTLAAIFADILEDIGGQPWLGNATTGQMLDEIRARVDCNYSTVRGSPTPPDPTPCPQVAVPNAGIPPSVQAIPPRRFADGLRVTMNRATPGEKSGYVVNAGWHLFANTGFAWGYTIDSNPNVCYHESTLSVYEDTKEELKGKLDCAARLLCEKHGKLLGLQNQTKPDLTAIRAKLWAECHEWKCRWIQEALQNGCVGDSAESSVEYADRVIAEFDSRFDPTAKPEQPPSP